jgi:DNA-binding CsgD family transcriptional regulator
MINAAITPGIHPQMVRIRTIKIDPQPLSKTAKGGNRIESSTLQILIRTNLQLIIKLSVLKNMLLLQSTNYLSSSVSMVRFISLLLLGSLFITQSVSAQYHFSGEIDNTNWKGDVYLSVIDDYRKISGVYPEQIIAKAIPDSSGYFSFSGNNLPEGNRLYRIHVDNCNEYEQQVNHFSGDCMNSREILFAANNIDTVSFPFSFDLEMFCKVESNNEKAHVFLRIDSLKNTMMFDFGSYTSEANRKINSKKWYETLLKFSQETEEPIAELYIYSIISDRSSKLYHYYLKDLKNNPYYEELLSRLEREYPDTSFTNQFKNELNADRYLISHSSGQNIPWWMYGLILILLISIIVNLYYLKKVRKLSGQINSFDKLTTQERKILDLIRQDRSNKEIASEMFVSVSTVKTHINNIYKKLNVSSRDEAKNL